MSADEVTPAEEIDAIIAKTGGWRAQTLADVRRVVLSADASITEEIKWRKPSKPEGVATWVSDGNVCMADVLKSAVRLTFPKCGQVDDPTGLFNARLTGDKIRAIDFFEGVPVDADALRAIVAQAAAANRG